MKTNHSRGFKDNKDPRSVFNTYAVYSANKSLELSDKSIRVFVSCGDHTNGKRGIAKDRRGAKKYMNSRTRFHENAAVQKIVKNQLNDMDE